ncbi:MAG: M48 family metallopeptidase [Planctomycetes bacterium]|nr:M48 family metallopeptidase [Planctomycetota bacterium]
MTNHTKTAFAVLAVAGFTLFILTTFVPYPPAKAAALDAGFSESDIATGLDYLLERRFFFWGRTLIDLGLLCALALTPVGRHWGDRFLAWTGQRRIPAALLFGFVYLLLSEIVYLPFGIGRLYHARAWGMSNLDLADWLREHGLRLGINLVWEAIILTGFYALLIVFPRIWWLLAPVGASGLAVAYAFLSPILISPLFNDFTPLEQTEWRDLQPRVQALIDKADIPVREILVMNASRQSNHTNAYFTGFGSTRRIVLYDTLLKKHTAEEIESVLGHEIGHWQHDHINKGILLGALGMLAGCFILDRFLRAAWRAPWHLQGPADPAGFPLVVLLVVLGGWLSMPLGNVVSRYFERQADQASLHLADQPDAFAAGEKKMARDNKSNVAPAPWNVWLFSSHPTTVQRIRMASEWKETSAADKKRQ